MATQSSPLLNLPAEIRNTIYEALFHVQGPLVIEGPPKAKWPQIAEPFGGTGLLATCQQVHNEAAGILYSRNAFLFDSNAANLKNWLRRIDRNRSLVRKLLLDLTESFSDGDTYDLDIRLVFRQLWRMSEPAMSISFVVKEFETNMPGTFATATTSVSGLNRMLAALDPSVSPFLKPIARSTRSLGPVIIASDGSRVSLKLHTNDTEYRREWQPCVDYTISNDGKLVRAAPEEHWAALVGLWGRSQVGEKILALLPRPNRTIAFDLDTQTTSQAPPVTLSINHAIRGRVLSLETPGCLGCCRLSSRIKCRLEMSTQEPKASFGNFAALEKWVANGRPRDLTPGWNQQLISSYGKSPTITLNFKVNACVALEDLRIEVTEVVFRTFPLSPKTAIAVQHLPPDDRKYFIMSSGRKTSTLYSFRRALLVFLSDLATSHPHLQRSSCPRIWADGLLRPREASFGGSTGVLNEKCKWSASKLNKEKEKCIARFAPYKVKHAYGRCKCDLYVLAKDPDWNSNGVVHAPRRESHETLLSSTKFLARFVKHSRHPETEPAARSHSRSSEAWEVICEAAHWKNLRPLRPE
jgi:hypothetical protein